VHCKQSWASC